MGKYIVQIRVVRKRAVQ